MSIMYCEKHHRRWDSDKLDECPDCEHEPEPQTLKRPITPEKLIGVVRRVIAEANGEPQSHALPPGMERLYKAVQPFVKLMRNTSGRIPYERLSAADWHELDKAYTEATPPNVR